MDGDSEVVAASDALTAVRDCDFELETVCVTVADFVGVPVGGGCTVTVALGETERVIL